MSQSTPIVLYDIPCTTEGLPWSPSTMKTRYCLGYKGLSFTTVWVEFPDIADLLKSKGLKTNTYTLPAIEDPSTGVVVADSIEIAKYLDRTYPETPKLLPPGALQLLKQAGDAFPTTSANDAMIIFMVIGAEKLNPISKEYYHRTREALFGERWTRLAGFENREQLVEQGTESTKAAWKKLSELYDNTPGTFALGDVPCFVDFVVASRIKFALNTLNVVGVEKITGLDGGRWTRLEASLEEYFQY
ncbi:hypothetical protein BDN67DRAFT_955338 [Paxillus ammoniavirescens]|nr:hypothetical protein BDN67DRAFT_955338 [Paxillus ammoniavirescens]